MRSHPAGPSCNWPSTTHSRRRSLAALSALAAVAAAGTWPSAGAAAATSERMAMLVHIGGLPLDVNPRVTITGPGGFKEVLTRHGDNALVVRARSGTYTVEASPVRVGGRRAVGHVRSEQRSGHPFRRTRSKVRFNAENGSAFQRWGWFGTSVAYSDDRPAPAKRYVSVATSDGSACGLLDSGAARCWGETVIPPAGTFKTLTGGASGGATAFCGIRPAGNAECWPNNGATPSRGDFVALSTDGDATCGLTIKGGSTCWWQESIGHRFKVSFRNGMRIRSNRWEVAPELRRIRGPLARISVFQRSGRSVLCGTRSSGHISCTNGARRVGPDRISSLIAGFPCGQTESGATKCWEPSRTDGGEEEPLSVIDQTQCTPSGILAGGLSCYSNTETANPGPAAAFASFSRAQFSCGIRVADDTAVCWDPRPNGTPLTERDERARTSWLRVPKP